MNVFRGYVSTPLKLIDLGSIVRNPELWERDVHTKLGRDSMTESVCVDIVPKLELAEVA
jgi:hypothetical protein